MEQNKEMTAQQSLQLISEAFNNSRKDILRGGAVFAMLVKSEAQLLIFTLGGVLLLVTGFIMKLQYK